MSLTHAAAHVTSGAFKPTSEPIDQLCVNTIRTLAMDAVQAANSGHPGTPMALAPVVYCLWQRVLRLRRWLHDGRDIGRGCLAGGTSQTQ